MTDHLPECPVPEMDGLWGLPLHPEDAEANCLCARLRACEQRVLDAAEAAVAELPSASPFLIERDETIAAIRALKEKP